MPKPRKAGGPSKRGTKAAVTVLTGINPEDKPPLPDPNVWLAQDYAAEDALTEQEAEELGLDSTQIGIDELEWHPAVKEWWTFIWDSPMASEYIHADLHGLYLGCYYLHQSLNPDFKISDRNNMTKQFENVQKNYGLTPSARQTLRWQVAQGEAAQGRTNRMRENQKKTAASKGKQGDAMRHLYSQHTGA